jgi:pyridoxal/pyridoxine/pyridoxamine kinase
MLYVPVRLFACCQDAGGTDQPLDPALLPFVSYLCPNELELQALTGSNTQTQEEVGQQLGQLRD